MSDVVTPGRHYAYPLVTWGSTLLGAAVALVTAFMLNLLGAALGIAVAAMGQTTGAVQTGGFIGIVWLAVANLVALAFGAWVAGRSTANPDHHGGTLQGIAVWAVTSFAVVYLAGSAMAGLGGAAMKTADIATNASNNSVTQQADRGANAQAPSAMQNVQTAAQQNGPAMQDAAVKTAGAAATAAVGAFLAMALGLVAAIVGARLGARHPNWADRPRYTIVERRHDSVQR